MKSKTLKVLMALILCPLVMFVLAQMLPKRYTATMSLMVDQSIRVAQSDRPDASIQDITQFSRPRSIGTQLDLILGTDVLLNAIQKTAEAHPDAFKDQTKNEDRYASLINRLRVDNNKDSDVVQLRVTMDDPVIAADTANNIGSAYMEAAKKLAVAKGNEALFKLNTSIAKNEKDLARIDDSIQAIKSKYNISDPAAVGQFSDKMIKDTELQIAQTEAQYTGAVGELAAAQRALAAQPKYVLTASDVSLNPAAIDLDNQISRLSSQYEALRAKYTDGYGQVQQIKASLDDLRAKRRATPDSIPARTSQTLNPNFTNFQSAVAQAESKVSSLSNSLATLKASLSQIKAESSQYPLVEAKLAQLQRDKLSIEQTYQRNVQTRDGLDVTGGMSRTTQAQIVSVALPPGSPSFPNPKVFVLMGLAIGIIISALIVMPKAPEVLYSPTPADTLALDSALRTNAAALPENNPPPPSNPALQGGSDE